MLVAGAGLAGLAAARDLAALGADVTVVDARDRVGGRVWTIRDGFAEGQHAEAGGDMIDEAQHEIRDLCKELGLKLTRILRGGFGYVRPDASGKPRIVSRDASRGWERLAKGAPATRSDGTASPSSGGTRRSPPTSPAGRSPSGSTRCAPTTNCGRRPGALRGFFLADPDELSLIALVDQFAAEDGPAPWNMYRIEGGNDRLAAALAAPLGDRVRLNTELVAVSHRGQGVRATVKHGRAASPIACDYLVLALPATTLRRVPITPALPAQQHDAIARLKYGRATKTLLQFSRRFWRSPGRPRAFGSPLPFGAVWDGNEEQRGRPGILALLAGGASAASQAIVAQEAAPGFADALDWLGSKRATLLASRQIVWEHDPLARGGYAYFDPGSIPRCARGSRARASACSLPASTRASSGRDT